MVLKEPEFPSVSFETPHVEAKRVIHQWVVLRGLESPNASEKVLVLVECGSTLSPATKAESVTEAVMKEESAYTDLRHLI